MKDMTPLGVPGLVLGSMLKNLTPLPLVGQPDVAAEKVWSMSLRAGERMFARARSGAYPGDRWFLGWPRSLAGSSLPHQAHAAVVVARFGAHKNSEACEFCPSQEGNQPLVGMIMTKREHAPGVWDLTLSFLFGQANSSAAPYTHELLSVAGGEVFSEGISTGCKAEDLLAIPWVDAPSVWMPPQTEAESIRRVTQLTDQLLAHI